MVSRFDQIYRSILLSKFFTQGWGHPETLRKIFSFRKVISNREACQQLIEKNYPVKVVKREQRKKYDLVEAEFISPMVHHLPGVLPKELEVAKFQMILPKAWRDPYLRPVCIHLAGTGDHGFWRRRNFMAKPLLKEAGIASIILENPFYGSRKPHNQLRSSLRNVSDLFIMGGCLVLESIVILRWCEQQGLGPLGITGISMGGHMASLAASNWPKPLTLIPCLSWTTASGVFTQGVLSAAINWEILKDQYFSDEVFRKELFNMIQSPEGHFRVFHEISKYFARDLKSSIEKIEDLKQDIEAQFTKSLGFYTSNMSTPLNRNNSINHTSSSIDSSHINTKNKPIFNKNYSIPTPFERLKELARPINIRKKDKKSLLRRYQDIISSFPAEDSYPPKLTPVVIRPAAAKNMKPVKFDPYFGVEDPFTFEALQFMRGVMDECTHLGNFSVPVDPSLIIIITAEKDGYIPRDGLIPLTELWPGCHLRTINNGHVGAFLFHHQVFRDAIKDSFNNLVQKYY